MINFSHDVLRSLAMCMDCKTLCNFIKTCKRFQNKIDNEIFWKNKLHHDFPDFINRQENCKKQYFFLSRILTKERFYNILKKPSDVSERFERFEFSDLYALLYNTTSIGADWGMIELIDETDMMKDFEYFEEMLYKSKFLFKNEYRNFLDDVKNGFHYDFVLEFSHAKSLDSLQFYESLKTLEERFQNYIVRNTEIDVRKQIDKYLDNMIIDGYNKDEIEFLQILHDGVRSKKLKIFDPVEFDFLMNNLKRF